VTGSDVARRVTLRRALVVGLAVAIAALTIAVAGRVGTLLPGGAAAATTSPPPSAATAPPTTPPVTEPPPTVPPPTPTPMPPILAPLTGLPVSQEAANRHPIAVMVDDHADARPQAGFNAASIVWQAPAEWGIPRYMLIFQDQVPDAVGPIRSARQYYIEWAAEWTAMYVHHGGSPQAMATLRARGNGQWVFNADGFRWEGRYVFRVTNRIAPHNVMTDGRHLRQLAKRIGAKDEPIEPVWSFGPGVAPELRPDGGRITVRYPYETIQYRYDAATNTYARFIAPAGGKLRAQVDVADATAVAPTNVVILRMAFGPLNDGHPDKGRVEARNVGKGTAWIATNGRTVKGTWRKASRTAPTLLFGPDGNPITLAAGQTFVQVIDTEYSFEIKDGPAPVGVPMQAQPN
jgi:DUF3048 family protein